MNQPYRSTSAIDLATQLSQLAEQAIEAHGNAYVVLAGGTTPVPIYRALGSANTDFARWTVIASDERCLPVGHPDRNDTMLRTTFVDDIGATLIDIPAELGPERGAQELAAKLEHLPAFDVAVLGIGDDGHTASLFTRQHVDDERAAIPVTDAPKPPPERVSIGASRLASSRTTMFVVGSDKQPIVDRVTNGDPLPATQLYQDAGASIFIVETP